MIIHGIYLKSKPKNKWHLVSIATSSEAAIKEIDHALEQAKLLGNDQAEAAIQIYDSTFHIPELLSDINKQSQKIMFN